MKLSYLDDFNARINATGKSIGESQFHSTQRFIESTFADSPFYHVAKWNGEDLEVQLSDVNSITRSNQIMPVQFGIKFCRFLPNVVLDLGEIIGIPNEDKTVYTPWMVVDFTSENKLFPKAKIEICNFELQVKTGETKTLLGYDDFKAPVYDIQPTYATMSSVLKNTIGNITLNSEINLPSERMLISIAYNNTSKLIKENDEFDMYGRQYKVVGIDFSNVYSDKGIITLTTERVTNT
jgi:hypothetical protein